MIVLDSSFLIAYHNTRDVHHAAAARSMVHLVAGKWGDGLLLEYVVLEVVTVLRARVDLETATKVADQLLRARELTFVPCSDLFLETYATFKEEAALSFADAAIATVARRHDPGFVATFDDDFRRVRGLTVVPPARGQ